MREREREREKEMEGGKVERRKENRKKKEEAMPDHKQKANTRTIFIATEMLDTAAGVWGKVCGGNLAARPLFPCTLSAANLHCRMRP